VDQDRPVVRRVEKAGRSAAVGRQANRPR
jgi:hypothetical protein